MIRKVYRRHTVPEMVKKIAKQVKSLVKAIPTSPATSSIQLSIHKRRHIQEDVIKKILRMSRRHSNMYTKHVERKHFPDIYKEKIVKLLSSKFTMYYSSETGEIDLAKVSDDNLIFLQSEIDEMNSTWVKEIKEYEETPYTTGQRMILCIIARAKTEERIVQLQRLLRGMDHV